MSYRYNRLCLICYDIADPRRLQRLHRYLSQRAVPVQYSVFLARLSQPRVEDIKTGINTIIDPRQDDVRIYYLPEKPRLCALGDNSVRTGLSLLAGEIDMLFSAPNPHNRGCEATQLSKPEKNPQPPLQHNEIIGKIETS